MRTPLQKRAKASEFIFLTLILKNKGRFKQILTAFFRFLLHVAPAALLITFKIPIL